METVFPSNCIKIWISTELFEIFWYWLKIFCLQLLMYDKVIRIVSIEILTCCVCYGLHSNVYQIDRIAPFFGEWIWKKIIKKNKFIHACTKKKINKWKVPPSHLEAAHRQLMFVFAVVGHQHLILVLVWHHLAVDWLLDSVELMVMQLLLPLHQLQLRLQPLPPLLLPMLWSNLHLNLWHFVLRLDSNRRTFASIFYNIKQV